MEFIEKRENTERFYSVDYDKEKLKEILEKTKEYGYVAKGTGVVGGSIITKWPATEKNIRKRTIDFFYHTKKNSNANIYPETIVHHAENDSDYVTYVYAYYKFPDLYSYIEIVLNNNFPTFLKHRELFEEASNSIFYAYKNSDQLVLEGILNYENSEELTDHNSINADNEYDYKGLNELYKETLRCFKFNLIAIKEYLKESEPVNAISLKLKK